MQVSCNMFTGRARDSNLVSPLRPLVQKRLVHRIDMDGQICETFNHLKRNGDTPSPRQSRGFGIKPSKVHRFDHSFASSLCRVAGKLRPKRVEAPFSHAHVTGESWVPTLNRYEKTRLLAQSPNPYWKKSVGGSST